MGSVRRSAAGYGQPTDGDEYVLRISQYVYFALMSEILPASTITDNLGIQPDSVGVRGAKRAVPPVPVCHTWRVECRTPGLRIDEQVALVLGRIRPVAEPIRALVATGSVSAVLQVVRYFSHVDGEVEDVGSVVMGDGLALQKLAGQHQLLGWHLDIDDVAFLASLPACLDAASLPRCRRVRLTTAGLATSGAWMAAMWKALPGDDLRRGSGFCGGRPGVGGLGPYLARVLSPGHL
jgi:hypothetical protein